MAQLAILQPDARGAARLSGALNGSHDFVLHSCWESLEEGLAGRPVEACLVDVDHPDRDGAKQRLRAFRARFPDLAVVACVESAKAAGFFGLGELGLAGVVVTGGEPARVRTDVDVALRAARAQQAERALNDRYQAPGPAAIAWAVEHAGTGATVGRLATGLGHTPGSLREALSEQNLPTPATILLWGRLLLAGARLGDDDRRAEDVAFSLGYATSTSLSRAMKQHTGLTPAEVSRRGGMSVVLDALLPPPGAAPGGATDPRSSPLARWATTGLIVALSGCATFGSGRSHIDDDAVERVLASPDIDQMHVGILAIDAATGQILYTRNAHRKFVPASNQKILLTATALSLLGPDYRFRTEVWATGSASGSFLDGDLVLVGSGDPSMSGRYWDSGTAALEAIADSLVEAGLRYVAGSTFVDVSSWDSTSVAPTREADDLRYAYGSTGGAFSIDEGEIEVVVRAGPAVGSPAVVQWAPIGTDDFVRSRIRTSPPDSTTRVMPSYLAESRQLVLEGVVEWGTTDTLAFAMRDPVRQAAATLAGAMQRAGIETEGGWEIKWTPGERVGRGCLSGMLSSCGSAGVITAIESPALSELIGGILKPSQNWMSEQLVRALGADFGAQGSWAEGVGVMEAHLVDDVGVDPLDIVLRDGSGLSAYNLVTPRAIVRVLHDMHMGPHASAFRAAMAEPGDEDSTLEDRLPGLAGRLFAKTGTISNVNSLSGYLVGNGGQEIIFSILTNGSGLPSTRVQEAIDAIVEILAR